MANRLAFQLYSLKEFEGGWEAAEWRAAILAKVLCRCGDRSVMAWRPGFLSTLIFMCLIVA